MKRFIAPLVAGLLCLSLVGCKTYDGRYTMSPDWNYVTETEPTVESLKTTHKLAQIYKNTTYYMSDFKADGSLKKFSDYDFTKEDAPCTVMGDGYIPGAVMHEEFYTISAKYGDMKTQPYMFQCRPTNKILSAHQFRLYMIGTYHDCQTRRWEWADSSIPMIREYGMQCAMGYETATNKKIAEEFKKAFRPSPSVATR